MTMFRWLMLFVFGVAALAAQQPDRPWMQGTVEKYCHATPADVDKLKRDYPEKAEHISLCACQSVCDREYEHAGETDGRRWMTACDRRCNPNNCNCPHPCDS